MKLTEKQLETAIRISANAHFGQVDKAGKPYIFHPLRVMNSVDTIEKKIVAILHDVVEDTDLTFNDLLEAGVPKASIEALKLLTHEKDAPYMDYIKIISSNPVARSVKIADLTDNSDLSRLSKVTEKDLERLDKYKKALDVLKSE